MYNKASDLTVETLLYLGPFVLPILPNSFRHGETSVHFLSGNKIIKKTNKIMKV